MRRCSLLALLAVAACSGSYQPPAPPPVVVVDPPAPRPIVWYVELVDPVGPSERETFDTMEAAQAKVDEWAPGATVRLVAPPEGVRLMEWFFTRPAGGGFVRAFGWDKARDIPDPLPRNDWPPVEETPAQ